MPAIRDSVFAQEAVTTDGGLYWPMCNYEVGDLLFVFLFCDTSITSASATSAGTWNQLYIRNNTAGSAVFWKYAVADEPALVTFTAAPNDTYCGVLLSVRDVYQSYTVGSPPLANHTTQASATKYTAPTLTTTDQNSLILLTANNSSNNSSILFGEGAGIQQTMINGTAESGSVGWLVQPTIGTTSAVTIGCSTPGSGVKAVIEVRQPVEGASSIPAYCVSDTSTMLCINPGLTYDGSTALAATADTNWGTSLGGITCNDATVATNVVDVGVDPKGFIASAGITNASSTTAISGAELVVPAASYNIGNSNILAHVRSVTTVASQNLGAIGTTRGVWFGIKSGTTTGANYRIWQVHGNDAPYYGVGVVPIIINAENTDTRVSNGSIDTADVRRYGFWVSGSATLTGQTIVGPIWVMGSTVVAGGTNIEPINIESLEWVLSKGKTRWSSIRQGANQLLCMQEVQFGNGGTSPIYLDLNTTAIEFPSKRNVKAKLINYNGTDNKIGFTYYAGATDTIKHRASVISSPSKYHWRIHPSSSALATYDFSGLSIIGAGDVQLRPVTTFENMSFTECNSITLNGSQLDSCSLNGESTVYLANREDLSDITNTSFTYPTQLITTDSSSVTANCINNTFSDYDSSNWGIPSSTSLLLCFEKPTIVDYSINNLVPSIVVISGVAPTIVSSNSSYGYSLISDSGSTGTENSFYLNNTLSTTTDDFTIELTWTPISGLGSNSLDLIRFRTSGGTYIYFIRIPFAGTTIETPAGTFSAGVTFTHGTTYHIAYSRQSGVGYVFVNGILIGSGADATNYSTYNSITIGNNGNRNMPCYINDLIYTKSAKYTSNFTPSLIFKKTALKILNASGTYNINVTGDSPPYTSYGATVNIISSNSFIISNLVTDSEVRIFRTSDQVELCGVERIGTDTPSNCVVEDDPDNAGRKKLTYTHGESSLGVYIVVTKTDYQHYYQNYTLTNTTQGLLVSQIIDRNFRNP